MSNVEVATNNTKSKQLFDHKHGSIYMVQTIKIILLSATKTWALSWVDSEKYQISNLYPPKKMQDWVHITLCTYMGKLWTLVEEFRHSM